MSAGCSFFSMTSLLMMHFLTPCRLGRSYITSSITSSRMLRKPRAPVLRPCARFEVNCAADASRHDLRRRQALSTGLRCALALTWHVVLTDRLEQSRNRPLDLRS